MQSIVNFYRAAFLQHAPPRHAAMQPQARYDQTGKKYDDHRGNLSDNQIAALLRGQVAYAVPYAAAGLASVLAFDVDSDHLPDPQAPIRALLAELEQRSLWAFAQYDPDRGRGYVWAPFADLTHAGRLAVLGDQILTAIQQPEWKIEHRTSQANAHSDTRLPLSRHTWTGRRGLLILPTQQLDLDTDSDSAIAALMAAWQPNPLDQLPDPPPPPAPRSTRVSSPSSTGGNITIDRYNQDTDLIALLESYGATPARGRAMHCCGHPDQRRASLIITIKSDRVLCQCMSAHHNCPLSGRQRDAFGVYCAMEGLTTKQALRRLNGKPDDPAPKICPQRLPAVPGATRADRCDQIPTPTQPSVATQPTQHARQPDSDWQTVHQAQLTAADHERWMTCGRRALLRSLQQRAGASCFVWASVAQYMADTGLSERATRDALRWLERQAYIVSRPRLGETTIYHLTIPKQRGGQTSAPTCDHESDLIPTPDSAGRGGQSAGPLAPQVHDQAECSPAIALALADDQADNLPPRVELVCGTEIAGPAGAFAIVGGAAYVPAGAETWYASIQPIGLSADDQAGESPVQLAASFDPDDSVPGAEKAAPASPRRRKVPPTDPALRVKYFKLLGAAKKAKHAGQAFRLRELAATLLVEVLDDQAETPPAEPTEPPDAGTGAGLPPPSCSEGFGAGTGLQVGLLPRFKRSAFVRADGSSVPFVPKGPPAPLCGPELSADGWGCEWAGSGWRAVHVAGYVTGLYINPEAARRAVERRDYRPVGS